MRILKMVLTTITVLFLLTTAIGLMFPSTVRVSRAVHINAPHDTVYKYINDIKYWKLWMDGADTSTITFLSARTAGTGTVISMGTGEMTVTRCSDDSVYTKWESKKGNIQNSVFIVLDDSVQKNTSVQWYFEQQVQWYPWERFGSMANDKILGPVMEKSLDKLQQLLDAKK
jgi:uncharacterized membrane protein